MANRGGEARIFRRNKRDPCADFWHTLRVGVPLAIVLFLILPAVFRAIS